jgi:SAM-dependent methyltransferase
MSAMTSEMKALKKRLTTTWNTGDYGIVARDLEASAADFLARIHFEPGTRLLDLACGSGQVAIPAARAGAEATGVDIAPKWIEQARARAQEEGLNARFDEGDAEDLPYEDDSFDLVISLIGAMFAPRPERVAAEMVRVCRPGGRIVMGNWTPEGFIGQMLKASAQYVPPPALMPSPLLWGTESAVHERLREGIAELQLTRRMYPFAYPFPPAEVVDFYAEYFGPTNCALNVLDETEQMALRQDLEQLWQKYNQASDGKTYVEAEILEVVALLD